MNTNAIFVGIYGVIVFIGGLIGYMQANSHPSLIFGTLFSLLILISAWLIYRGLYLGMVFASILSFTLALFFSYRFFLTLKVMPAGFMFSLSLLLFLVLLRQTVNYPKKG